MSKYFTKVYSRLFCSKPPILTKNQVPKSAKYFLFLLGGIGIEFYLYQTDDDFIVDEFPKSLNVTLYRIIPFCTLSRLFGSFSNIEIPVSLRKTILGNYVKLTGCDMSEAKCSDINSYKSLSDLFQRQLKWNSRVIDRTSDLVSPCDGTVLHYGKICNDKLEQVKGVKFTLKGFFGNDFFKFLKKYQNSEESVLHYCIIYLAPGDYHRFHSPAECQFEYRRYFTGKLLSVNPTIAKFIPGLFSVNERVAYFGKWKYGLFTFTAVGATNVGNIVVMFDNTLPLNANHQRLDLINNRKEGNCLKMTTNMPITWEKPLLPDIHLSRGQLFGKFLLGSTIVLVFEAPPNFSMSVKQNQKVLMGSPLGSVTQTEINNDNNK